MSLLAQNKKLRKAQEKRLALLSGVVGDFIRYWGFRRIHGQLWTQIYLSKIAQSGVELQDRLGVSKALVSKGLQELQDHGLIHCLMEDGRTKRYQANPRVFEVIRTILKSRETVIVKDALTLHAELAEASFALPQDNSAVSSDRLRELGDMITAANFALEAVTEGTQWDSLQHLQGLCGPVTG